MGYIKPPEPADDVVMVEATETQPAFTWGDHRMMSAMLDEAEASDPNIAAARARLDATLVEAGFSYEPELVCQWCWHKINQPHDTDCRDHNDPALWVKREAAGYQYMNDKFVIVHTTSVPMTDQEALEYFGIVQLMFTADPDLWVRYIMRRDIGEQTFKMMPFQYNKDVREVFPIERPGA